MQISSHLSFFCILVQLRRSCLHRILIQSASALSFFRLIPYERSISTHSLYHHTSLIDRVPGVGLVLIPYMVSEAVLSLTFNSVFRVLAEPIRLTWRPRWYLSYCFHL